MSLRGVNEKVQMIIGNQQKKPRSNMRPYLTPVFKGNKINLNSLHEGGPQKNYIGINSKRQRDSSQNILLSPKIYHIGSNYMHVHK